MSEAEIAAELDKLTTGDIAALLSTSGVPTNNNERKSRPRLLAKLSRLTREVKTKLLVFARRLPANPRSREMPNVDTHLARGGIAAVRKKPATSKLVAVEQETLRGATWLTGADVKLLTLG